ncbi:Alpha/Beta hydrolase protein [Mycena sp. CBHHK59/15]|nr:Alpha/Beta hydrolase protein [Mycena sp. CBHHK59/15]
MTQPIRTSLSIPSLTPGWNLDTWSFMPSGATGPVPVIVMANGLGCNKLLGLATYAEEFTTAGYACLAFDYRRWGTSDGNRRNCVYVHEQLDDYRTVVKYARLQPQYDPQRVIIWGFSFAGGHILTLASDPSLNVAASISHNPYCGRPFPKFQFHRVFLTLYVLAYLDLLADFLHLPPVYISAAGLPGEVAALTAPGAVSGFRSVTQTPRHIAASIFLRAPRYNPSAALHLIQRPILLTAAKGDTICPHAAVVRTSTVVPTAELVEVTGGHFDIFAGNVDYERALQAQLNFLQKHVPL